MAKSTGGETWNEVVDAFSRYLRESFRSHPAPATKSEATLVRMFIERSWSPREVVITYRATLKSVLAGGREPPFNPTACLQRVLARLIEEYQHQLALAKAVDREKAAS